MSSDLTSSPQAPKSNLSSIFAVFLLRLWIGMRALQSGIEKYASSGTVTQPVKIDGKVYDSNLTESVGTIKSYGFAHYHGIPTSLQKFFTHEPLVTQSMLYWFDVILGPALIVLGITILLGLASRFSLFLLGLIYLALTWGLVLIHQDAGIAWLGVHIIMISLALHWADFNRLCILRKW